jgi:hypothetical protein
MNKTDSTMQERHGILRLREMFTLTQTGTKMIKDINIKTSKHQNNYYKHFVSRLNSH